MNPAQTTAESLALMKAAQAAPDASLAKAWTQSGSAVQGITAYDLEAPAKKLYPVITPLRNRIPRTSGKGGIQANWRAITGINTGGVSAGVGGGNRGGVIATSVANYSASYAGLGLEDYATFEADYAAEGFDDIKALTVEGLLRSLMIQEERIILGGNSSLALGQCGTATLSAATTGGAITGATGGAKTIYVQCVALTLEGFLNSTVSATGVPGAVSRTNADSSTDSYGGGSSQPGTEASQVCGTSTDTNSVNASVTAVNGAVAYAWYWASTTGAERLGAITTINSVVITSLIGGASTQLASALSADNSQNSLVFDGLLTQLAKPGSGSYVARMATGTPGTGTPLTSDSAGGIVEIDTALKSFWDNYRLSPTDIYVNAQELLNISKKVLSAASTSAQRFTFNVEQGMLAGGTLVRSYLNKFGMNGAQEIPIRLHPNVPPGTIVFFCDQIPYPLSNVSNVLQVRCRRDYYQIEWPMRSRKYEYGVYADEVLQNYFPPAFGFITNVANG